MMTHNDPDDPGHDMTCPKDIQSFMGQENWRCLESKKKHWAMLNGIYRNHAKATYYRCVFFLLSTYK